MTNSGLIHYQDKQLTWNKWVISVPILLHLWWFFFWNVWFHQKTFTYLRLGSPFYLLETRIFCAWKTLTYGMSVCENNMVLEFITVTVAVLIWMHFAAMYRLLTLSFGSAVAWSVQLRWVLQFIKRRYLKNIIQLTEHARSCDKSGTRKRRGLLSSGSRRYCNTP